jgi:hypothetical protein
VRAFAYLVTVLATLFLISCSREPLDGAVYVIKGSGDITRAASIDVRVLPYSSLQEFYIARSAWNEKENQVVADNYRSTLCSTFSAKTASALREKQRIAESFSLNCVDETNDRDSLKANALMPESLSPKINSNQLERTRLVSTISETLEKKAKDAISTQFDYQYGRYGRVVVRNDSDYWIITGTGEYTATFSNGVRVMTCNSDPKIAPKTSWEQSFGSCASGSDAATLVERGAKICRENDWYKLPCLDEFGINKYDGSVPGSYRNGGWIFAKQETQETRLGPATQYVPIDFNDLAVNDPKVKSLDGELRRLRSELQKSNSIIETSNACEKVYEDTAGIKQLSCPQVGTSREDLELVVEKSRALGLSIESIRSPSFIGIKEFAELKATEVLRTNVDGGFRIANPPKGGFLLQATYRDNFNKVEWLVPVSGDATSIELNNSNSS